MLVHSYLFLPFLSVDSENEEESEEKSSTDEKADDSDKMTGTVRCYRW